MVWISALSFQMQLLWSLSVCFLPFDRSKTILQSANTSSHSICYAADMIQNWTHRSTVPWRMYGDFATGIFLCRTWTVRSELGVVYRRYLTRQDPSSLSRGGGTWIRTCSFPEADVICTLNTSLPETRNVINSPHF